MKSGQLQALAQAAEPGLRSLTGKAALALLAVLAAGLVSLLGDTWPLRILLALSTLQLVLIMWLYVLLISVRVRLEQISAAPTMSAEAVHEVNLSEEAYSILCMAFDGHNHNWSFRFDSFLKKFPSMQVTDVVLALGELDKAGFLIRGEDAKDTMDVEGYDITPAGMGYVKARRAKR